ncbi:hypothetical protein RND81_06G178500 [Saponaria officinalis]|uniref:40S ribosomal protein S29 n=1 Tax=Saponaria officinalis TaxID=3572 RepID=A0AAW1KD37_SAPOF
MGHSNIWNSHPKTYGPGSRTCRVCGNPHAIIRKYGLMCCRQCFRSNAKEIGFIKVRDFFFHFCFWSFIRTVYVVFSIFFRTCTCCIVREL